MMHGNSNIKLSVIMFAIPLKHSVIKLRTQRSFQTSVNIARSTGTSDRKKMKVLESFETSGIMYQSTRRNVQEDLNLVLRFPWNIPVFWDVPHFVR